MISCYIAAVVCLVLTFFCGANAVMQASGGTNPQNEFLAKQFTAGAWFFGVLCLTFLGMAGVLEYVDISVTPVESEEVLEDVAK